MSLVNYPESTINRIELDWFAVDGDEVVVVTPRDLKRFEVQIDRAIEILQLVKEADRFNKQFKLLLDKLASWLKLHTDKVAFAHMTLQDGTLAFVVVRRKATYDESLQDDLADLDIEVANDGDLDLIKMSTLALPNVGEPSILSFLDKRLILTYSTDGKSRIPHSTGEQEP